ncbi:OprO/OprP family phosphate-selective porin [Chitinophaga nivalis]|uniref:OprO/OprP family phosphate-selective porin n=1 Tax=Chitinophaga nivalis TaxID=2991709 RepID=A0ABT3IVG7_9BACT|nr:OprO/OprP family phosphate-selective porin [Chitinophaga nivalis]MCW3462318.1 OprO/OprP family phosphate-selective porin [Chitinophaga nivalis]MCW3487991.1 OprO/OprP family phosphate-selective porin [Chitinophaga nivalis]
MRLRCLLFIIGFLMIQPPVAASCSLPENNLAIDSTGRDSAVQKVAGFLKKITLGGVFQARYTLSLHKDVDVNGMHQPDATEVVRNSFSLKRARLQVKAQVSDRFMAAVLVNLADFSGDTKGKVLENAYISYRWNDAVNFTIGQFRPSFGLEDLYPVDIIKSMDFSNQYYAFGNNGWQSFQLGVSMFGSFAKDRNIPIKYSLAVVNGNNRNQPSDNDNGKLGTARLELGNMNRLAVGLNGGFGVVKRKNVYAFGVDVTGVFPLSPTLDLELQTEYKQGTDHQYYYALHDSLRIDPLNKYLMHGVYVLPNFRYKINYHKLTSIEFSVRYEYFNEDYKHDGNTRQTFIPMISLAFLKDYGGRLQLGMQIDQYKKDIPGTKTHNSNLMIVQVQCRL